MNKVYLMNKEKKQHSLDDDLEEDFKGTMLRMQSEKKDESIFEEMYETNSVAKLPLSNDGNNVNNNLICTSDKPAVLCGVDVVSPIGGSPIKYADDKNENASKKSCTDIMILAKPFEGQNFADFFSYRDGLVEKAVKECIENLIDINVDGSVVGSWLLTEISFWDNEKERLLLLTEKCIITVKYDFIVLRQLEYRKVALSGIDTIILGDLVYPSASLVPRINGLVSGVSTVFKECIVDRFSKTNTSEGLDGIKSEFTPPNFNMSYFEPRKRGMSGIRLMWNKGKPLAFSERWNPFNHDIPFNTYACHPLYWHKGSDEITRKTYDIEDFSHKVVEAVEQLQASNSEFCKIQHKSIMLENYVGIGSLIHNRNALGFFMVRGKFSF